MKYTTDLRYNFGSPKLELYSLSRDGQKPVGPEDNSHQAATSTLAEQFRG